MKILAAIVGVILIFVVIQDSFESIVLPRRVSRRFRLSRMFYASTWMLWSSIGRKMRLRESTGVLSELLWPAFSHPNACCLGISPRALLRTNPMGAKFTSECAGEGCNVLEPISI